MLDFEQCVDWQILQKNRLKIGLAVCLAIDAVARRLNFVFYFDGVLIEQPDDIATYISSAGHLAVNLVKSFNDVFLNSKLSNVLLQNEEIAYCELLHLLPSELPNQFLNELIEKKYEDELSKEEFTGQSKAKFYVLSALSIQDKEFVNECKTVKEIIDRLKVKYMKPEDMYHLSEESNSLKWGTEAAEVFIAKMNDIKTRMKKLDKDLKDDNFFYKLIDQVPHFLSITKQQILYERYRKQSTITYENACDTLIQAYNTYQLQKKMKQENGERQNNDQRNSRSNNSAFFT